MILFGIKNCDTVRKAHRWLEAQGHQITFHDFRVDGLDKEQVQQWVNVLGWVKVFNKRSTSFRALADEVKAGLNEQTAIELMVKQPTLVKRPVLVKGDAVINGFKAEDYQAWLSQ
ncbi:arsenate reductase [Shewanella maritima]|uniref:arsenate reductase n=1 Tax=Shewanella maritima TaxID=2520507 RepID=UPI0037366D4B